MANNDQLQPYLTKLKNPVSRNINKKFEEQLTFGDKISDKLTTFAGSWTFIILFLAIVIGWMFVNVAVFVFRPFDPYPFILLNLVLSTLATLQAPVIMMSQNRESEKDRLRSEHDYLVDLKAEAEIAELHRKLDELREEKWKDLMRLQQKQIELLEKSKK